MNIDPVAQHGTPEWHAARKGRITASMAPAILTPGEPGVFGNPLSAWMELTGRTASGEQEEDDEPEEEEESEDIAPSDAAEYGIATQQVHAKMLERKCAGLAWSILEPGFFVSPVIPWLGASPDAIGSLDGAPCLGEFKAPTNLKIVKELRHGVPMPYVVQAIVQMVVLDIPQDIVSVLYPPTPTWQRIHRSPDLEAWVMEGLRRFWEDHVIADTPPAMDARWLDDRAAKALSDLYPPAPGTKVYFTPDSEGYAVATALEEAKAQVKEAEEQVKVAKARLIEISGGAERIYLPDGSGYTRSKSLRNYAAKEAKTIEVTTLLRKKRLD